MIESIKITSLNDIGSNLSYTSLVPVVNMTGLPDTEKSNVQVLGNYILSQAGGAYMVQAAQATLAQSVTNAAQPNITSVGTLTSLTVSGNVNLSTLAIDVGNLYISGGQNGYVLQTDGSGNLSWTAQTGNGGNGIPGGANTQIQFNDAGSFGGSNNLRWNTDTNTLITNSISVSNVINSVSNQIGITPGADANGSGTTWTFDANGGLYWPAAGGALWVIQPNPTGEFEVKSTSNVIISTDIQNTNSHFTFDTTGIFTAPSNVNLLGSRLNVGEDSLTANLVNPTVVVSGNADNYIQTAIRNASEFGSADMGAYGAEADDSQAFTDMGFAGYAFNDPYYSITGPGDGYLFAQGYANGIGGNLVIATGEYGNSDIVFATGGFTLGTEFARFDHTSNMFHLTRANSGIEFSDGTIQTTAAISANTGNIQFVNDTMYDLNGIIIENSDLSHGATAALILPLNGNTNPVQLTNTYGNVVVTAGANANTVAWDFQSDGNLMWGVGGNAMWHIGPGVSDPGEFAIHSDSNLAIYTNTANASQEFVFDNNGNFTAPGNVILAGPVIAVGPGANTLAEELAFPTLVISSNSNTYVQAALTNVSDIGSADWIAYGHHGNDAGGWTDMGFASSFFSDPNYTITEPGDGYIFVQGYPAGQAPAVGGGSLVLATGNEGLIRDIVFATGGFLSSNEFARIEDSNNVLHFTRANSGIQFNDGTYQNTAAIVWTAAPVSNTSAGDPGQAAYDSGGNLYICVSTNTWAKFSGTTSW